MELRKGGDRPEIRRALDHCRMTGARLLIANADRPSRKVALVAGLMQAGVKITAVDMSDANELTFAMAAVAQVEHKAISERVRVSPAAAKVQRTTLGTILRTFATSASDRSAATSIRLSLPKGPPSSERLRPPSP